MGCATSKHTLVIDGLPAARPEQLDWLQRYQSADGQLPVMSKASVFGGCAADSSPFNKTITSTTIQDLPPALLVNILSRQENWIQLHRTIPLVCRYWHGLVSHATPAHLRFRFDIAHTSTVPQKHPYAVLPGLQRLNSWRVQRRQQQQQQQRRHALASENAAVSVLDDDMPWDRWLQEHSQQLQDLSISISAIAPSSASCNEQQYRLKELALQALAADSADAAAAGVPTNCCSRSSGSCVSSTSSDVPDAQFDVSPADGAGGGPMSPSNSNNSSTGQLQLRSLELMLPLFEHDVQLMANSICSRAPQLHSLALVGYTSTAKGAKSSNSRSTTIVMPHHLAPNHPNVQQQQQQQQQGALAPHPGAQQQQAGVQPAQGAGHNSANEAAGEQKAQNYHIIRQGFITGSSLQHLLASAPGLRSFTFACRQLYKTTWLAPATQLTHLSLRECQLTHNSLSELVGLKLPQLVSLDLSLNPALGRRQQSSSSSSSRARSTSSSSGGPCGLHLVSKLTQVTRLDISGWDLAEYSKSCDVRRTAHNATGGGVACAAPFAVLGALRQLAELTMDNCGIVDWSLGPDSQAGALMCPDDQAGCLRPDSQAGGVLQHLTSLSLSGNPLGSASVAVVCSMTQLRRLALAGLTEKRTGNAAAAAVAPRMAAANGEPHNDQGHGSGTGSSSSSCWSGLRGMPNVSELNLADNWFSERDIATFRQYLCPSLSEMSGLRKINLSGCKFPYMMARTLFCNLPPSLCDVTLDGCVQLKRGDLQALGNLPSLKRLSVANMQPGMRDKHAEVLAGLSGLRVLVLAGNNIGPSGCEMLIRELQQLRELNVAGNPRLSKGCFAAVAAVNAGVFVQAG